TKIEAAANQMERAAVELQISKLADAYDPAQVQALSDLLDAKKIIDDAAAILQRNQMAQQKESIREAFTKLLKDQQDLDVRIKTIDAIPKNEEAPLPRAAPQLSHHPPKQ